MTVIGLKSQTPSAPMPAAESTKVVRPTSSFRVKCLQVGGARFGRCISMHSGSSERGRGSCVRRGDPKMPRMIRECLAQSQLQMARASSCYLRGAMTRTPRGARRCNAQDPMQCRLSDALTTVQKSHLLPTRLETESSPSDVAVNKRTSTSYN